MTDIITGVLCVALFILMALSGLILIPRVIAYRDPFDIACTAFWAASTPIVGALIHFLLTKAA